MDIKTDSKKAQTMYTVTMTLTEQELVILGALTGSVACAGVTEREFTDHIYRSLNSAWRQNNPNGRFYEAVAPYQPKDSIKLGEGR